MFQVKHDVVTVNASPSLSKNYPITYDASLEQLIALKETSKFCKQVTLHL